MSEHRLPLSNSALSGDLPTSSRTKEGPSNLDRSNKESERMLPQPTMPLKSESLLQSVSALSFDTDSRSPHRLTKTAGESHDHGKKMRIVRSFVPDIVMEHLVTSRCEAGPFSEEFQAAVVLADISGFTQLTERLSQEKPRGAGVEELSNVLNNYFGRMIDLVHHYGGDVLKFAGDALFLVFRDSIANGCVPQSSSQGRLVHRDSISKDVTAGVSCPKSNTPPLAIPTARLIPLPDLPDEASDICMRCGLVFRGLGVEHRRRCAICGCMTCLPCCTSEVLEQTTEKRVSVCDCCFSSSRQIAFPRSRRRRLPIIELHDKAKTRRVSRSSACMRCFAKVSPGLMPDQRPENSESTSESTDKASRSSLGSGSEKKGSESPISEHRITETPLRLCGICFQLLCQSCCFTSAFDLNSQSLVWCCTICCVSSSDLHMYGAGMRGAVFRSVDCCMEMIKQLDNLYGLRLHIGIGVGNVMLMSVGGLLNRWEFLMAGNALVQMSEAEGFAHSGEVCISAQAWSYVSSRCTADGERRGEGFVRVLSVSEEFARKGIELAPMKPRGEIFRGLNVRESEIEQALMRYIPGAIRGHLSTDDHNNTASWSKEIRKTSILFVNLPGIDYSAPSDWILSRLQMAMENMQRVLYLFEGSLRQFIVDDKGTTMIAVFGLYPLAHENDALLATRCALGLRHQLQEIGITCKIGVTTGTVFAGAVGNDQRREYAVIGDVVNLSASTKLPAMHGVALFRSYDHNLLMTSALKTEGINVLCDKETYKEAQTGIVFRELDPIKVKGKSHTVRVFTPVREKVTTSIRERGDHTARDIVGHQEALSILATTLDDLLSKHTGGVVFLEGPLGTGKSRIIRSLAQQAELSAQSCCRTIACCWGDPLTRFLSYRALAPLFQQILGLPTALHRNTSTASLRPEVTSQQFWQELPLNAQRQELDTGDPVLFILLSERLPGFVDISKYAEAESVRSWTAEERNQQLQVLLDKKTDIYLQGLKSREECVLVQIENIQWLDKDSVHFLESLSLKILKEKYPVLLTLCGRPPEDAEDFYFRDGVQLPCRRQLLALQKQGLCYVELPPLSRGDTIKLMASYLQVQSNVLPTALVNFVFLRSAGNPLYVEEVLRSLQEQSIIPSAPESWEEFSPHKAQGHVLGTVLNDELPYPDSLQGIVCSKIDRLKPREQWLLKLASVVGMKGIHSAVLSYLLQNSQLEENDTLENFGRLDAQESEVEEDLKLLVKNDFLIPCQQENNPSTDISGPTRVEYQFRNSLFREAAYSIVAHEHRRKFHATLATYTELYSLRPFLRNLGFHAICSIPPTMKLAEKDVTTLCENAEALGHHWSKAGEHSLATEWFEEGAVIAERQSDYASTIKLLRSSLKIRPDLSLVMRNYKASLCALVQDDSARLLHLHFLALDQQTQGVEEVGEIHVCQSHFRAADYSRKIAEAYTHLGQSDFALSWAITSVLLSYRVMTACVQAGVDRNTLLRASLRDETWLQEGKWGRNGNNLAALTAQLNASWTEEEVHIPRELLVGSTLPHPACKSSHLIALLRKTLRNARKIGSVIPNRVPNDSIGHETSKALFQLARAQVERDDIRSATHIVIDAVALVDCLGYPCPALAEGLSMLSLSASVIGRNLKFADKCSRLAIKMATLLGGERLMARVKYNLGKRAMGEGSWNFEASSEEITSTNGSSGIGSVGTSSSSWREPLLGKIQMLEGFGFLIKGSLGQAAAVFNALSAQCQICFDPTGELEALVGTAATTFYVEDVQFFATMQSCSRLESSTVGKVRPAVQFNLLCLHLRSASSQRQTITNGLVQTCVDLATNLTCMESYSVVIGYFHAIDSLLEELRRRNPKPKRRTLTGRLSNLSFRVSKPKDIDDARKPGQLEKHLAEELPTISLLPDIQKLLSSMKRFSKAFYLGRPVYKRLKGSFLWYQGYPQQAIKRWKYSAAIASQLNMKIDVAFAYYEMGRHFEVTEDMEQQKHYLSMALNIFQELNCLKHDMAVSNELQQL